jgi:hypothetical protein
MSNDQAPMTNPAGISLVIGIWSLVILLAPQSLLNRQGLPTEYSKAPLRPVLRASLR